MIPLGVDALTIANCIVKEDLTAVGKFLLHLELPLSPSNSHYSLTIFNSIVRECVSDHGKALCTELAGECVTVRDGYYLISTGCILAGAAVLYFFVQPEGKKLQGKWWL